MFITFRFLNKSRNKKHSWNSPQSGVLAGQTKQPPVVEITPHYSRQIARGPKNLFAENINYNIFMLSSRLPDPNLAFEHYELGSRSHRKVAIAYLKDVANPGIVSEIKDRIESIKAETILDSSYVERNIEDSNLSPFPQLEKTSRPDVTESALSQGRIAVFVDKSPDVLLAPATLFDLLDTPDDAYRRWFLASSFYRIARLIMVLIAAFLPGFYIALTSFSPELIPTNMAFLIASSWENLPLPVYLEAFVMMGVAEAIRMVMLRMPSGMGQTIALFTGLTLVGAGLYARLFGAPIVIIVTLTVLASMAIPDFDLRSSIRMVQFSVMVMASVLGIFGFGMAFFYLGIHMAILKSFGIPYLAPVAPVEPSGWGHTVLRKNTVDMPEDETYQPLANSNELRGEPNE
ncbi:MAG: spore germination protein [Eubacteriales bacterium]